ncbi:MAG TPA: prolipoprotein diacylglyceryl transferase family protein [Anaerolineales bacterium]
MVAFYFPGDIPVYAFSVVLGVGATLGLAWVSYAAGKSLGPEQFNAGLWALLGGLVGSRAAYVAAGWSYFQSRQLEGLQVFQGGLAWPGALAGSILALVLYTHLARQPLRKLADVLLPLAACLAVSAWLASWLEGSAYGSIAASGWGLPARDEWGKFALRFPTQLLGAAFSAGLFWLLDSRKAFPLPGLKASLGLLGLSLLLFGLSFLRADPAPLWLGWRLESWAALGFAGLALAFIWITRTLKSGARSLSKHSN